MKSTNSHLRWNKDHETHSQGIYVQHLQLQSAEITWQLRHSTLKLHSIGTMHPVWPYENSHPGATCNALSGA